MGVKPEGWKDVIPPKQFLCNTELRWVNECKYLGVFMNDDMSDDHDILRQTRGIYMRGNMILRNVYKCSKDVKLKLFWWYKVLPSVGLNNHTLSLFTIVQNTILFCKTFTLFDGVWCKPSQFIPYGIYQSKYIFQMIMKHY